MQVIPDQVQVEGRTRAAGEKNLAAIIITSLAKTSCHALKALTITKGEASA